VNSLRSFATTIPEEADHDGRYHYIHNFNSMERLERERAGGKEINYFLAAGAARHKGLPEEMLFDTKSDPHEITNLAKAPAMADIKQKFKAELFRWMKEQNDYLTEKGPVPFLDTGRRFSLDRPGEGHSVPADKIGSLEGMTINPHKATAPKTK
jgi:hypothetical protein